MATSTQQQPQARTQTQVIDLTPAQMLDRILEMPAVPKFKVINEALDSRVDKLERVLPDFMRGQGARLIQRAMMTLHAKARDYAEVTPDSFIRCVLQAAELGLAIDGRLAHAVIFKNKKADANGVERWYAEATLMVDYKGLIAVARRTGLITDIYARVVRVDDDFDMYEQDGVPHVRHRPCLNGSAQVLGVYAIIKLGNGDWRYEWMSNDEIDLVRSRSKSWGDKKSGPWKTDDLEMRKKTVLRRLLKTYIDDPAISGVIETDGDQLGEGELPPQGEFVNRDLRSALSRKAEQALPAPKAATPTPVPAPEPTTPPPADDPEEEDDEDEDEDQEKTEPEPPAPPAAKKKKGKKPAPAATAAPARPVQPNLIDENDDGT